MVEKYNPNNNLLNKTQRFIESKKEDEEKSKSQPEESIAERVKLRRQKADNDSDEFINILDMPSLEDDEEEIKEEKKLKILTPKQLLTRPPTLLHKQKLETIHTNQKMK